MIDITFTTSITYRFISMEWEDYKQTIYINDKMWIDIIPKKGRWEIIYYDYVKEPARFVNGAVDNRSPLR